MDGPDDPTPMGQVGALIGATVLMPACGVAAALLMATGVSKPALRRMRRAAADVGARTDFEYVRRDDIRARREREERQRTEWITRAQ